jgi:hypothetical protein
LNLPEIKKIKIEITKTMGHSRSNITADTHQRIIIIIMMMMMMMMIKIITVIQQQQ